MNTFEYFYNIASCPNSSLLIILNSIGYTHTVRKIWEQYVRQWVAIVYCLLIKSTVQIWSILFFDCRPTTSVVYSLDKQKSVLLLFANPMLVSFLYVTVDR